MSTTPLDRLMDEAREAKRVEFWVDLPSGEMTAIHILLDRLVRIVEVQRDGLNNIIGIGMPEWALEQERIGNAAVVKIVRERCNRIAEGKEEL